MTLGHEIKLAREHAPVAAAALTQLAVDNPGQLALMAAGSIVIAKVLVNAVRPRTLLEALATIVVADAAAVLLARKALDKGVIRLRVRDADGALVPLVTGSAASA